MEESMKNSNKPAFPIKISFKFALSFLLLVTACLFPFLGRLTKKGKSYLAGFSQDESKIEKLKKSAMAGEPQKQLKLGIMYAAGVSGRVDHQNAVFWLRKAAEQGESNAQMLLSLMYLEGVGVRRNYLQAVRWARLSATQGNAVSRLLMGAFLEDGVGVKRDMEQAVSWYRAAAETPIEIGARQRLGTLYIEGKGVVRNVEEGLKWLNAAAEKGDVHAAFQLGMIYYNGRIVDQDYNQALEWYLKSVGKKAIDKRKTGLEVLFGQVAVFGEMYTRTIGQIIKRKPSVTRDAKFYVGLMYETGRGTEQDFAAAVKWYQKAADAGDEIAQQRVTALKDKI